MNAEFDDVTGLTGREKRALLERLLGAGASPAASNLTSEQRRLWFLRQLDDTVPWHVYKTIRLTGSLDIAALQQAMASVVERHRVMRMVVDNVNGQPIGSTAPAITLRLPVIDIDSSFADNAVAQEVNRPFDFSAGPLLRALLLRCTPANHLLVFSVHRLVADQRSVDLLVRELLARYGDLTGPTLDCDFGDMKLSDGSISFEEYAQRQKEWLATPDAQQQIAEWSEWLGRVPSLRLASDRIRPLTKTFRGASATTFVDPELLVRIEELACRCHVRRDIVLMAAYALLLARCSRQDDFAIGIPVLGRWDPETLGTIGPLESAVPVRLHVSMSMSFGEWVRSVGAAAARSDRLSQVPFEQIVEACDPPRDLSQTPLFQVSFTSSGDSLDLSRLRGLDLAEVLIDSGYVTHDLELAVSFGGDGCALRMTGNVDLFDAATIETMNDRLCILLSQAVTDPLQSLGKVPLLSSRETAEIAFSWNAGVDDHDRSICFHQLVERQANEFPERLAVHCDGEGLQYGELNNRANAVAWKLNRLGIEPESRVGVIVDRSVGAVVALLGVLKAGGAYVPVASNSPAERLKLILQDAGVSAVVESQSTAGATARAGLELAVVTLPSDTGVAQIASPESGVRPNNLAYIIYTSGSTGRPKGVAVEHRQIVASTAARWAYPDPVVDLMTLPLAFDAAAGGLHWTLSKGGTVIMASEAELQDPRLMAGLLERWPVSHINSMPGHYKIILDASQVGDFASLRYVDVGGEVLPPSLVAEHYRHAPDALLYNCYGPTEATIWASTYECHPADREARAIPIGRPIRNVKMYLLDEHLGIAAPGIPGEIYIGGEGVARGYANAPSQTAIKFIPDPFSPQRGGRLYRTGDLARYRPDGIIDFLGRADDQVKLRGFRIEPAEIEEAVCTHRSVRRAVVVLHDDGRVRRLVAYVACNKGAVIRPEELRLHVAGKVPDYMVPASFVVLDDLPLTSSGKVDRRALPSPAESGNDEPVIRPRTAVEDVVAAIFSDLLGLKDISVTSDFFEVGGDSLLLARLMNKLARRYDVVVPLEQIFRIPSVAGVSYAIENQQRLQESDISNATMFARQMAALRTELELDPSIKPSGLPAADWLVPREVLVTGGTGFIGAYLVAELLQRTDSIVHCLVRGDSEQSAFARLENAMRGFHSWNEDMRDRIRVVTGDLALPRLGMSEERFHKLARHIDAIYHSGALVNFAYSYNVLRPVNVDGTVELLRLATTQRLKAVHHVSTIDVWLGTHSDRPFLEVDLPEDPKIIPTSYARSKWVSEKLVSRAASRGIPVCIYRPWLVSGHRRLGVAHTTDYLLMAFKGYLELGILPSYNEIVNAIPVDFLAESIVHTSLQEGSFRRRYFHIGNMVSAPMLKIYEWLRSFGYQINVVDYEEARKTALRAGPDNALFALAPLFGAASTSRRSLDLESYMAINPTLEYQNLHAALDGSGIYCPPLDEAYVHRTLQYLVESGYLPKPTSWSTAAGPR
jgi:amino acid adenylation domain-containing protein/thioester reductase-like protein